MSRNHEGKNNPMYGLEHSRVTKLKISKALRGVPLSLSCRLHMSGKNNGNWKGGKSYERNYSGYEWNIICEKVLKRDKYRCRECRMSNQQSLRTFRIRLAVHHKKPYRKRPDLALRLSNLETLCVSCHVSKEDRL